MDTSQLPMFPPARPAPAFPGGSAVPGGPAASGGPAVPGGGWEDTPASGTPDGLTNPAASPAAPSASPRALEDLHPRLWRAHQLGRSLERTRPSGFAALDAQLPGGGWPCRAITELLLPQVGIGEVRLLAEGLRSTQHAGRVVMLFDPPAVLSAPALVALGLDLAQLLVIQTHLQPRPGADRLWAMEQALKSGHVGAVVAWLPPRLRAEQLRRLQLAAQGHDGLAFVFREPAAQHQASAAPLRLALSPAGADQLALRVLKRRGPPLLAPVHLTLPAVLTDLALVRARFGQEALQAGGEGAANGASHEAFGPSATGLPAATFINLG